MVRRARESVALDSRARSTSFPLFVSRFTGRHWPRRTKPTKLCRTSPRLAEAPCRATLLLRSTSPFERRLEVPRVTLTTFVRPPVRSTSTHGGHLVAVGTRTLTLSKPRFDSHLIPMETSYVFLRFPSGSELTLKLDPGFGNLQKRIRNF